MDGAMYESLLDMIQDAIMVWETSDESKSIVYTNPVFEQLFGWSREEYFRKEHHMTLDNIIYEWPALISDHLIANEGNTAEYDAYGIHKDGTHFPIKITIKRRNLTQLFIVIKDMTLFHNLQQMLRNKENDYKLLIETVDDIIAVYDLQLNKLFISPSIYLHSGYTPDEYRKLNAINEIHLDDVPLVMSALQTLELERKPLQLIYRVRHKNGEWIHLEARITPFLNELQDLEHFLVVSRNITERVALEEESKHKEKLLHKAEKLAVIGELAAGIAHEIRNPLTSLRGFIQYLQPNLIHHQNISAIILSELDRINYIASELLILSKPQKMQVKRIDIHQVLVSVITLLYAEASIKRIIFTTTFDSHLPLIEGESNRLKQVFINLVKNAIDSMDNGGEIHIETEQFQDNQVRIGIIDKGSGIPDHLLSKLGEPFYTTKEKGTGLGLMVSHKIIKSHKGSLKVMSKVGVGTSVYVILPIPVEEKGEE